MIRKNIMNIKIEKNIPLSKFTTFRIGGPAKFFTRVKLAEDLKEAFAFAKENNLKTLILGSGAKLLVSDEGFDGLVIKMEIMKDMLWSVL